MDTKHPYEETDFWATREAWTVMGDWLGREPALKLLDPKPDEWILDAGCGEGLLTEAIAKSGAVVFGVDRSEVMLRKAVMRESHVVSFHKYDITQYLPHGDMDAIFCCAVLMHDSPEECRKFFHLAVKRMRKGGRLVVSITHPYQYLPGSPTRDGRSKWTQFEPLEADTSMDMSCKFIEHYRNIHGQVFDAEVWFHPESLFPRLLQEVGFEVVKVQSTYVRPEHIAKSELWAGSPWGHPAYYQILAVKP